MSSPPRYLPPPPSPPVDAVFGFVKRPAGTSSSENEVETETCVAMATIRDDATGRSDAGPYPSLHFVGRCVRLRCMKPVGVAVRELRRRSIAPPENKMESVCFESDHALDG